MVAFACTVGRPVRAIGLILALLCGLGSQPGLPMAQAAEAPARPPSSEAPAFSTVVDTYAEPLAALTSEAEALGLYTTRLAGALDLHDVLPGDRRGSSIPTNRETAFQAKLTQSPVRLTAQLAAWLLGHRLRLAIESGQGNSLAEAIDQGQRQQPWLLAGDQRPELRRALALASVLAAWPSVEHGSSESPAAYRDYVAYLDQTYPQLVGSDHAWLTIIERDGVAGVTARLAEYWTRGAGDDAEKQAWAARYMALRVTPVASAYAVATAQAAETRAREEAWAEWQFLRSWRDELRQWRGQARLCGLWLWTIHNHQGHQDTKVQLSFPHPDDLTSPGARPARIVVLGDAVYLRWEFRQGFQEDSLLFSKEGTRLEGTFVNTAGAWGAISGKRTGPCQSPEANGK